jgi:DNA repair protein SbcC/Rad50
VAEGLRPGEPCPVCLNPVTTLPDHATPPGLDPVRAAVDAAEKKLTRARKALDEASQQVAAADATVKITRQDLDEVAATLAAAPGEPEVVSTLEAIARADDALGQAREAVRTHRRDLAAAKKDREDLAEDEARAWADLRRARDSVVGLGAPAVQEGNLAAAWEALATWVTREHAERSQRLPDLDAAASASRQEITASTTALLGLLSEHGIAAVTDPAKAPGAVTGHLVRAELPLPGSAATARRLPGSMSRSGPTVRRIRSPPNWAGCSARIASSAGCAARRWTRWWPRHRPRSWSCPAGSTSWTGTTATT